MQLPSFSGFLSYVFFVPTPFVFGSCFVLIIGREVSSSIKHCYPPVDFWCLPHILLNPLLTSSTIGFKFKDSDPAPFRTWAFPRLLTIETLSHSPQGPPGKSESPAHHVLEKPSSNIFHSTFI